jgi:hypothetical protein
VPNATTTPVQRATGPRSPERADPVMVAADGRTVVDDVLLDPGVPVVAGADR